MHIYHQYVFKKLFTNIYTQFATEQQVRGTKLPSSQKSEYNFLLPQTLTNISLVLIRSLTSKLNNQLTGTSLFLLYTVFLK